MTRDEVEEVSVSERLEWRQFYSIKKEAAEKAVEEAKRKANRG